MQLQEARLQLDESQHRFQMLQQAAESEVTKQKAQHDMLQRSQQQQGQVDHVQQLRAEMDALKAQMQVAPIQHNVSSPEPQAESQVAQALLMLTKMMEKSKRSSGVGSSRFTKFDSKKCTGKSASLWIDRLEAVGQEEGWFDEDEDLWSKMNPVLDEEAQQWSSTQPPAERRTTTWTTLKTAWKDRFV